jgi:hypothetical protein
MARKQKGLTSEGRLFLLARANTDKEGTYCNCKVTNPTRDARTVLPCKTTGEGEGRGSSYLSMLLKMKNSNAGISC